MNQPEMRIGDREREAAVEALGEHYVAGRLTKEEYDERSAVAWQARVNSQLAPLFVDLPALPSPGSVPVSRGSSTAPTWRQEPPPRRGGRGFRYPFVPVLAVILGLAILTDGWPVLLLVAILWWVMLFRWVGRTTRRARCARWPGGAGTGSSGPWGRC